MMVNWDNSTLLIIVAAIPTTILGYLSYRRGTKGDEAAGQSNIASNQIGAVGQVIDGLNKLVESLQEDNALLRTEVVDLRLKYKELSAICGGLKREVDNLKQRYGESINGTNHLAT